MSQNAEDVGRQSPTPSQGGEGSDLRSVAGQIEGLLDDDGHFNPGQEPSRGHPDYEEPEQRQRDERGRFKAADDDAPADDTGDEEIEAAADDVPDEDTDTGDTDEEIVASADEEAPAEDEDTAIETLAQFAEALEVPLDDLKAQLQHTFQAAGEEVTVTLAELEKGYQKDADYRRSTAKLAEERKAAELDYQNRVQQVEQHNQMLAQQLNVAEQLVAAELNDPRLAQLREHDPAEWTARREEIGQRLASLRNYRQQAAQQYQQFMDSAMQQTRAHELKALTEAIPDFGDSHKAKAKDALASLGLSPEEVGQVMDHRLIKGALELADLRAEVQELRELKTKAQESVKRVKKDIPKLQKPGKRREGRKPIQRDNIAKLRARAQKTGRVEDAAKVIEQLI